ncbi:MAG TPA: hypothetical protein VI653_19365 [Steroidobacteraceae bacterium]
MDGSASPKLAITRSLPRKSATPARGMPLYHSSEVQQLSQAVSHSLSQWLLDREQRPVFIITSTAVVVLMNDAARQVLQSGHAVEVINGKLRMSDRRSHAGFTLTLEDVRKQGCSVIHHVRKGVAMSIAPIEVRGYPERLLLCRLGRQYGGISDCEQVRRIFRLTLAEAEVALAIFGGKSLVDTARLRRTSINTVKAQSQRVFEKCGVHSQVDLARRLAAILRDADA